MLRFLILFIFSTNLLFSGLDPKTDMSVIDQMSSKEFVKMMGNIMAENAPMKIDNITTLTDVKTINTTMLLTKQINTQDQSMQKIFSHFDIKEIEKEMFTLDSKVVCAEALWIHVFKTKSDVVLQYNYVDIEFNKLFDYTIESQDCIK